MSSKEKIDKIKKMEKLFEEIFILFPKNSVSLQIHRIDFNQINRDEWKIEAALLTDSLKPFLVAKRINSKDISFDITLFGEA